MKKVLKWQSISETSKKVKKSTKIPSSDIILNVFVKPGAKLNQIVAVSDDQVEIAINAPPVDGEANTELIKYLSKVLSLRKSDLCLDRGSKSRQKIVKISTDSGTIDRDLIFSKLRAECTD